MISQEYFSNSQNMYTGKVIIVFVKMEILRREMQIVARPMIDDFKEHKFDIIFHVGGVVSPT